MRSWGNQYFFFLTPMTYSKTILITCLAIYLASGGRWSVALLAGVVYAIAPTLKPEPLKKTPVFTRSSTSSRTVTPGAVPLKRRKPKVFKGVRQKKSSQLTENREKLTDSTLLIFYTSLTGSCEKAARSLYESLKSMNLTHDPQLLSLDEDVADLEDYFLKVPPGVVNPIYVLVLPSYDTDSPIDYFLQLLEETATDFRVDKFPLNKLVGFSVLGLGDSESWPTKFCYQSVMADKWMSKLGARRIFPLGKICIKKGGFERVNEWIKMFEGCLQDNQPIYLEYPEDESDQEDSDETLVDVEDMGKLMRKSGEGKQEIKEMVAKDSPTYKSLTKQGYTVVGSHSGVKICRWTKSALRSRGSCYKYAFYGIRSHLCMETTPSLSCSNKCVFCWRHGTNPVGTNWRWQVNAPEDILNGAMDAHYQKIKQMRGVPGVDMERFAEAFTIRHCALSLVGEPIFYPHINEFVGMLHEKHISSFLVCNAQHPDQLEALNKVTQLYVSIDAPNKDELKKVDRPLFRDYWQRLLKCLDILNTTQKHQRTVFRLTLVKGFNMTEIKGYADFVERANPSQIEVKGATFCGSSSGNGNPLTMQNIPFYKECQTFVESLTQELKSRGLSYEVSAEHAHSCCILIAHTRFKIDGAWHTHIDYGKFFNLLESGEKFTDMDYIAPTPEWAYYGSKEAGFSPEDTRFNRQQEKAKRRAIKESGNSDEVTESGDSEKVKEL